MRSPGRLFWPLACLVLLADCTTKRAVERTTHYLGSTRPLVGEVVRVTLAYNQGAAFSTHFGPFQRWVLIGLTLAILAVLSRSYRAITSGGAAATIGLALVTGGAVGNLLDRVLSSRGVVDFLDVGVGATRFYIFNVADVGVSIGGALLAWALWNRDRAVPAPAATGSPDE